MYLKPRWWMDSEAPATLSITIRCFSLTALAVDVPADPKGESRRSTLSLVISRSVSRAAVAASLRSS